MELNDTLTVDTPQKDDNLSDLPLVIFITTIYVIIFITGVIGNVLTCIVISRNKSMHTATNYYLFSLAISDMLLLISGLPPEMNRLWSPNTYIFGQAFCILQGFAAETSANATVITITAFTVERYVAICHPFLSHTMSKLSRAIRYILIIWIVALCLAAPQAIQFGVDYDAKEDSTRCTVVNNFFNHAFEISTFLFFVGPMTLITVLYVLIGLQLRKSRNISAPKRASVSSNSNTVNEPTYARNAAAQNRVVKMLIAVVAAFFICWAPFHAQRLLAVYLTKYKSIEPITYRIYMILTYTSGILYFLSTTVNPILYHIMSNKFREAFQKTLSEAEVCCSKQKTSPNRPYTILCRKNNNKSEKQCLKNKQSNALLSKISDTKIDEPLATNISLMTISNGGRQLEETLHVSVSKHNTTTIPKPIKNDQYLKMIRLRMFYLFNKEKNDRSVHINRHGSVGSSQTISNSSLQDMDEIDFSSSDLVRYMEEINEDIA